MGLLLLGCGQSGEGSADISFPEIVVPESKAEAVEKLEERQIGRKTTASLPSIVNVRLLDSTLELSQSQVSEGSIQLSISNESAQPLALQVIRTDLTPEKIVVKEGQVDIDQSGVEVLLQLLRRPIKPDDQATLLTRLKPGAYKVVVTAADQDKPVAYTELLVLGVV